MSFYPPLPQSGLFMATEEKDRDLADHGNLTFSKKGQVYCCWRKGGISPPSQSITVSTWSEKNGGNVLETYKTICYLFLLL